MWRLANHARDGCWVRDCGLGGDAPDATREHLQHLGVLRAPCAPCATRATCFGAEQAEPADQSGAEQPVTKLEGDRRGPRVVVQLPAAGSLGASGPLIVGGSELSPDALQQLRSLTAKLEYISQLVQPSDCGGWAATQTKKRPTGMISFIGVLERGVPSSFCDRGMFLPTDAPCLRLPVFQSLQHPDSCIASPAKARHPSLRTVFVKASRADLEAALAAGMVTCHGGGGCSGPEDLLASMRWSSFFPCIDVKSP